MGAVWLGSLPQVLRDAGLVVETWPGWETRSRSTGGYNEVRAIGIHHDAAAAGTPLRNRCTYAWHNAPSRPIGALWLHTDGKWVVGAAGATNTQGLGGPYTTSKGVIPKDQGNLYILSVEASNNGIGEHWPPVQQESYLRGCGALCKWLSLNPNRDIIGHWEWTTRKRDPAGPSRYASGAYPWNMELFRRDTSAAMKPPYERIAIMDTFEAAAAPRWDTRGFGGPGLSTGEYNCALAGAAGKLGVTVNITIISAGAGGFATAWKGGARPDTSKVNYPANAAVANEVFVPLAADGSFKIYISSQAHIIVDLVGYWS